MMMRAGLVIMALSAGVLLLALAMDTSVGVSLGGGYREVSNLAAMQQQQNLLLVAVGGLIVGAVFVGFGSLQGTPRSGERDQDELTPLLARPDREQWRAAIKALLIFIGVLVIGIGLLALPILWES